MAIVKGMTKVRREKKTPRTALIKQYDDVFSKYIRLRDKCTCITCGKTFEFNRCQAGHYVSRSVKSLRWDEQNVHCQCVACNIFGKGKLDIYIEKLIDRYGQDIIEYLKTKRTETFKPSLDELRIRISEINAKIKELEK